MPYKIIKNTHKPQIHKHFLKKPQSHEAFLKYVQLLRSDNFNNNRLSLF